MKKSILTAVSAAALMAAAPSMVQAQGNMRTNNPDTPAMPTVSERQIERGWENTKDTVSRSADRAGDAVEHGFSELEETVEDDTAGQQQAGQDTMTIRTQATAQGIIGNTVYTTEGQEVATVEDIILDQDGQARMIVLRDGGFFGFGGKLVALDYNAMTEAGEDGDVLRTVDQSVLNKVAEFSYDSPQDRSTRVIPAGGISVSRILGGEVLDNRDETVANVDNIIFSNGEARYLVLSFNEMLGVGGDKAILGFNELQPVPAGESVNFRMTARQAAEFENFKRSLDQRG